MSFKIQFVVALVLATVGTADSSEPIAQPPNAGPPAFALRVNPRWAREINDILASVAQPTEVVIPPGQSAAKYLGRICGTRTPAYKTLETTGTGVTKALVAPCARITLDVHIRVVAGDTLERLALRNGLSIGAAKHLKVIPSRESKPRITIPETLETGDVVVFPEVPLWTHIVTKPGVIANRETLIAALASKLKCGAANPAVCLARRGVSVLDGVNTGTYNEAHFILSGPKNSLLAVTGQDRAESASAENLSPPTMAGASGVPPRSPSTPRTIPVAAEQWPYDVGLLAAILKDASAAGYIRIGSTIGIADGGLGSFFGNPLPPSAFDVGVEQVLADLDGHTEPDGIDNDRNGYVDDIYGASIEGTGDLNLCNAEHPSYSAWGSAPLSIASHGAVVSAVASALELRRSTPEAAEALPKLAFFRMLANTCDPNATFDVKPAEIVTAVEFLKSRANVINISYLMGNDSDQSSSSALKQIMPPDILLVLAAGEEPRNLDDSCTFPACLGNDSSDYGGATAKATLVVAEATRDLHRAPSSNYGPRTVGIFAPGEPVGAVDLGGQKVSDSETSTSYAAPLVALAAGIVRSFGGNNISPQDIKDRLAASSWPLEDSESQPEMTHVGVLDLVKAAAVRYDAVEVKEAEPDGQLVRRTYVGKLLTPLHELTLCTGVGFQEAAVQAIRLGEPNDAQERSLLIYYRAKRSKPSQRRLIEALGLPCKPQGVLRLRTLTQGNKTFPLSEVTEIQLQWL